MDDDPSFGRWLQRRRKRLDLTQAQLGACAGCTGATIRKIEADERRPSHEIAALLVDCLQIPVDERDTFLRFARGKAAHTAMKLIRLDEPILRPEGRSHNLPVQRDRLIGREHEVAAVSRLLRRDELGLITLTGPGGTGKTRLALHVAAAARDDFPDGVWFVDLAPLSDSSLVIPAIARTLGVSERAGTPLLVTLSAFLREKHLLLLLDNFEHVAPAAPALADLLASAARLKLLVTSRTPLHLSGEQEYLVPPLALPESAQAGSPDVSADVLSGSAAVELFVQRAQRARPEFQITDDNTSAVAEICIRLDGLPLAIELAAARIKVFTPAALLQRLGQPLGLLTGGSADRPARHQGLRDTIAWSYNLLSVDEQQVFRRLAVFVGGCTLEAAEVACSPAGAPGSDVLSLLTSLVDKSLVRQETGVGDEPRFRMLETIRAYALELLAGSREEEDARLRHAGYFLRLVEIAEPVLFGRHTIAWLDRLEEEHANLRAVLAWVSRPSSTAEQHTLGLRLAGALWGFWRKRGHYREGRQWLEALLAATDGLAEFHTMQGAALRAKALRGAGKMALDQFELAQGIALSEAARLLAAHVGDKAGLAEVLANLGWGLAVDGDVKRASALVDESLNLYQEMDDAQGIASALYTRAYVARAQGQDQQALELLEESQALFRRVHDVGGLAWAIRLVGVLRYERCDYKDARAPFEEAIALFRTVGEKRGLIATLECLGFVLRDRGDYAGAMALHKEALCLSRDMGDSGAVGFQLLALGRLAYLRGDLGRAAALHEEGLPLLRQAGDWERLGWGLWTQAKLLRDRRAYTQATTRVEEALALFRTIDHPIGVSAMQAELGTIRWLTGDSAAAATMLQQALAVPTNRHGQAGRLIGLACVLVTQGQVARAVRLLAWAEVERDAMGLIWEPMERTWNERALAVTRSAMEPSTWDAAWAEGQTMTMEQAMTYALESP